MSESEVIRDVELKDIKLSPFNVRKTEVKTEIVELAESIKIHGLLQPVVLIGEYGKPPYELIVGQRRWEAHKLLGRKKIRAIFHKAETELQLQLLSLSENMHRAELNHTDKAKAITELYITLGKNAQKVARETGLSYSTVLGYIKIEEQATPKAKALLEKRSISKEDVKRAIKAAQGDESKIDKLLDELPKLTKYEKDRAVEYGKKEKTTVNKIIEAAKRPKYERTVILNLDEDTDNALSKAGKDLAMDREEIAELALEEWLRKNGFLKYKTK